MSFRKINKETEKYRLIKNRYSLSLKTRFFSGPNPITLERKNVKQLIRFNSMGNFAYHASIKIDGVRMMCMFYDNYLWFFDRDLNLLQYTKKIFENVSTKMIFILDGEMYKDKYYYAFDVVYFGWFRGDSMSYAERFSLLENEVMNMIPSAEKKFIKIKPFFNITDLTTQKTNFYTFLKKSIPGIIKDDGIIFAPFDAKYKEYGPDSKYATFKWKPADEQTIDFRIKECQPSPNKKAYNLLTRVKATEFPFIPSKRSNAKNYGTCGSEGEAWVSATAFRKFSPVDKNGIYEFKWSSDKRVFTPIRYRADKSVPNALHTARSVWKAIQYPVEMKNIEEVCRGVYAGIMSKIGSKTKKELIRCINTKMSLKGKNTLNQIVDGLSEYYQKANKKFKSPHAVWDLSPTDFNKDTEIEFRLGHYNKYKNGVNGVPRKTFLEIYNNLDKKTRDDKQWVQSQPIYIIKENFGNDSLTLSSGAHIEKYYEDPDFKRVWLEEKVYKTKIYANSNIIIGEKGLNLKMAISHESISSKPDVFISKQHYKNNITHIRKIVRKSFVMDPSEGVLGARVDFSVVNDKDYEIEVEFVTKYTEYKKIAGSESIIKTNALRMQDILNLVFLDNTTSIPKRK